MIGIVTAGVVALFFTLFLEPVFIRLAHRHGWGQFIREDGPRTHMTKRGTPTMGGVVFIVGIVLGYLAGKLATAEAPTLSGVLCLFLMIGLGLIGLLDDITKVRNHRSLGLTPVGKLFGQLLVTGVFAWAVLQDPDGRGLTPASTHISFLRDLPVDLFWLSPAGWIGVAVGAVLFFIWIYLIVAATSNSVNITDGLDGLATGSGIIVFGAYGFVTLWQFNQDCARVGAAAGQCYEVRDPLDLAIVVFAVTGALVGFLWWNTSPAQVFMGDTGSLALGGALAAVAIMSRTELLLVIVGGIFVMGTASVLIQTTYFKLTHGRRIFLMSPIHHHFELKGWPQVTVVVRFWILAGMLATIGLSIFYAEWVSMGV